MSALTFICLIGTGAVLQALPPELLWDNNLEPDFCSLFGLSPPGLPSFRLVDDIEVSAGGWLITGYAYTGGEWEGWMHSGFTEMFVWSDINGTPGDLFAVTIGADDRIETDDVVFGFPMYEYHVEGLRVLVPPGAYWIGGRDPLATGEMTTNFIASSDGGSNGGCPPDFPQGSCQRFYRSNDSGETWLPAAFLEQLAFRVRGLRSPGDFDGNEDVNLADFAAFHNCVTGPGGVANVSCSLFDFDNDQDVDFTDFQVIQIVFAWK